MATTLATFRRATTVLYDVAGSQVLDDADWNVLINAGLRSLWSDVVTVHPNFRVLTDSFTLTTLQTRALPATYRDTLMVKSNPGIDTQEILPRFTARIAQASYQRSYRLEGTNLLIEPLQRCAGTYAHIYVPNVTPLVNDTDQIDAELDKFTDYIPYHAANVALAREESEQLYAVQFDDMRKQVRRWAAGQRSADADTVDDVRGRNMWSWGAP